MGKLVKAAKLAVAVAAWLAAHTSFATETINATGGNAGAVAGASAGAIAGSSSGATSGATGGNPSATVSGGSTRAFGASAAANNRTCMYPTAMGLWQNQEEICAIGEEAKLLTALHGEDAGKRHLCQGYFMRETLVSMHGKTYCDGVRLRNAPRAPHFRTDSWAEGDHWAQQ